jgi:hypothetical protein
MSGQKNRITVQISERNKNLLEIDAWLSGRTVSLCAGVMLSEKIQEEEPRIKEDLEYLAKKRGLTPEELTKLILNDEISL